MRAPSSSQPGAVALQRASHFSLRRYAAIGLIAAAFAPAVVRYFQQLWSLEHYQFFPFALLGAGLLARRSASTPMISSAISPFVAGGWSAAGWGFLIVSILLGSPWSGYVGAIAMLVARLYNFGGRANVVRFLPSLVMLLSILRPPLHLDLALTTKLQQLTARAADAALDLLDIVHVRIGNVLEIPGRQMFVEEACSGVNSLFSALACTLFYLLWTRRHAVVWVLLLASVPLWVLSANATRITLVALLRYRWNIAADEGLLHDVLGLFVFAAAMLLILSTERLLTFYAAVLPPNDEIRPGMSTEEPPGAVTTASSRFRPVSRWSVAVALVLLFLQVPGLVAGSRDRSNAARAEAIAPLGADFLESSFGAWRRTGYETVQRRRSSAFGEYSQLWTYAADTERATASLDYPFAGWHELTECYTAQGWQLESRVAIDPSADRPPCIEAQFRHPQTGRYGRLWFTLFDDDGRFVKLRTRGEWDEFYDFAATRLRHPSLKPPREELRDAKTYQVQLFLESYAPPTATDDALRLFGEFARRSSARQAASATQPMTLNAK